MTLRQQLYQINITVISITRLLRAFPLRPQLAWVFCLINGRHICFFLSLQAFSECNFTQIKIRWDWYYLIFLPSDVSTMSGYMSNIFPTKTSKDRKWKYFSFTLPNDVTSHRGCVSKQKLFTNVAQEENPNKGLEIKWI